MGDCLRPGTGWLPRRLIKYGMDVAGGTEKLVRTGEIVIVCNRVQLFYRCSLFICSIALGDMDSYRGQC